MPDETRSKAPLVAIVAVVLLALGVGGYFLAGKVKCDRLEEDYLNSVSSVRGNAAIRAALSADAKTRSDLDELDKLAWERVKTSLQAVYDECGSRAGQTAARKASDTMLQSF